jgi:hypothetical protein
MQNLKNYEIFSILILFREYFGGVLFEILITIDISAFFGTQIVFPENLWWMSLHFYFIHTKCIFLQVTAICN